jgi:hypothetical protein
MIVFFEALYMRGVLKILKRLYRIGVMLTNTIQDNSNYHLYVRDLSLLPGDLAMADATNISIFFCLVFSCFRLYLIAALSIHFSCSALNCNSATS